MGCCNNFRNQRCRQDRFDRFDGDGCCRRFDCNRRRYDRFDNRPNYRRRSILPGFPKFF